MMRSTLYIAIVVMLLLAVVQTAVLPHFPITGLVPQLSFLVALAWALLHGLEEGLVWGFVAGFWLDIFSIGPLGATALAYMAAILVIVWLLQWLPNNHFFIPLVMAALGTLVYLIVYLVFARLLGYGVTTATAVSLLPLILLNAAFMLPVYWLINRLNRLFYPPRVEL
jgi:rod shape-determining protein MreD